MLEPQKTSLVELDEFWNSVKLSQDSTLALRTSSILEMLIQRAWQDGNEVVAERYAREFLALHYQDDDKKNFIYEKDYIYCMHILTVIYTHRQDFRTVRILTDKIVENEHKSPIRLFQDPTWLTRRQYRTYGRENLTYFLMMADIYYMRAVSCLADGLLDEAIYNLIPILGEELAEIRNPVHNLLKEIYIKSFSTRSSNFPKEMKYYNPEPAFMPDDISLLFTVCELTVLGHSNDLRRVLNEYAATRNKNNQYTTNFLHLLLELKDQADLKEAEGLLRYSNKRILRLIETLKAIDLNANFHGLIKMVCEQNRQLKINDVKYSSIVDSEIAFWCKTNEEVVPDSDLTLTPTSTSSSSDQGVVKVEHRFCSIL